MNPGKKKPIKVGAGSVTIMLSEAEISSGSDANVPDVELKEGTSVIYQLDENAQTRYRYKKNEKDAFILKFIKPASVNSVLTIVMPDDFTLMATMKKDDVAWEGKVTLGFEAIPGTGTAEPPPFDPIIINGKK